MTYANTINAIAKGELTHQQLVTILLLSVDELGLKTVSGKSREAGITPPGLRKSNRFIKLDVGGQEMAYEKDLLSIK